MNEYQLARNLGIFSLGLGLAEILAPRQIARLIGIDEQHETTLQLLGLREVASGLGIMQGKPAYFLWSRVAGDIMDLGLLGAALDSERSNRRRVKDAMLAVAAVTALDLLASALHTRSFEDPAWRDERPMEGRGAISRDDPKSLRASTDEVMSRHQPHSSDGRSSEQTMSPVPNVEAGF
jgi:hypothetical protein